MIARMISRGLNKRGADIGSTRTSEDVEILMAVSKFQSHQGCTLVSSVRWMSTPVLHGLFGIVGSSIIAEEAGLLTRASRQQACFFCDNRTADNAEKSVQNG